MFWQGGKRLGHLTDTCMGQVAAPTRLARSNILQGLSRCCRSRLVGAEAEGGYQRGAVP